MNTWIGSHALCPYYIKHGRNERVYSVCCEFIMAAKDLGFAPELRIGFRRKQDFMDYAEIFCCDKYTECPVFKAILQGRGERV